MANVTKSRLTILVALIALIVNAPLISALLTSLKSDADINAYPPKFVFSPTGVHYINAVYAAGYNFPQFFENSSILAVCASLLVIVISLPAAYSMVRYKFGTRGLLPVAVGLRLFPPIAFAIPYYLMYQTLGLLDTITGLVLIDTFLNLPLGLLLMIGFLRDVPREIEEAAVIDGASTYQILVRIVLPLMGPAIAAVGIFAFVFTWDDYLFALMMTFRNATTVTVGAANFVTSYGIKWGDISAATILSILPPVVFAFLAQRYLVRGLSLGAVKG